MTVVMVWSGACHVCALTPAFAVAVLHLPSVRQVRQNGLRWSGSGLPKTTVFENPGRGFGESPGGDRKGARKVDCSPFPGVLPCQGIDGSGLLSTTIPVYRNSTGVSGRAWWPFWAATVPHRLVAMTTPAAQISAQPRCPGSRLRPARNFGEPTGPGRERNTGRINV